MKEIQSLQGQAYDYLIEMIKDGGLEAEIGRAHV